jgi:hypothetical protein
VTGFDWRRPPTIVHVEPLARGPVLAGEETAVQWTIGGPVAQQVEDAERLAKGLICPNCMEPLPAKPGLDSLVFFREVWTDKPEPWRTRALDLAAQGCCPVCACSVDESMHELFHEGVEPGLPDLPPREKKRRR